MTPIEARKTIDKYQQSIKDLRPNAIVQSTKELPYTSARIKFAHFVYGEHLVKNGFYTKGEMPQEMLESFTRNYHELMESYGLIDSLFCEEPELINSSYRKYLEGLRNGVVTNYRMPNPFGECAPVYEYHHFIGECWFLEHHTNIFDNSPLGAFIYEAVRKKATEIKDITTLIKIVNAGLTRSVNYPGISNSENMFIQL